ncbi:MAG: GNAT family N-acetyltransferase [Gorillibacterium sp.]|nr:GNAT family N-acetyltransferase [Gorillibacterium sp.]
MSYQIGNRIVLREYRMEDLAAIRQWTNDSDISGTVGDVFIYPQTLHQTESFLRRMVEGTTDAKGFIISEKDTLAYIGQIDLNRIDWRNRVALLGIVIGRKDLLGQGYGREAIGLIKTFVFETLNLNRLELDVYANNERAVRCYLSCGFREEGRLRQRVYKNGTYHDDIKMSILRSEYEAETLANT